MEGQERTDVRLVCGWRWKEKRRVGWERCRRGERDGSNLAEVVVYRMVEKLESCQLQTDKRCPQRWALEAAAAMISGSAYESGEVKEGVMVHIPLCWLSDMVMLLGVVELVFEYSRYILLDQIASLYGNVAEFI